MKYSIAHREGTNLVGQDLWPDGRVPWNKATPPDIEKGERYWTGHLRKCAYCGSMHPADVAAAIRTGAKGEFADWKYGWPHKAYFDDIPNPHAGLLEIRCSANYKPEDEDDWIQTTDGKHWHEPGRPAAKTTRGKFYIVHLMDATPEERKVIETHLGFRFDFMANGQVRWHRIEDAMSNCKHMSVWIETKVISPATYDFPAETMSRAVCKECGESIEIEDIPIGAEEEERESEYEYLDGEL